MNPQPTLADYCSLIVDCEHKTAPLSTDGYPSIRTPNIGRGRLILEGVNRVDEETYRAWTKRAVPRSGDLIVAREAPVGNVAIIPPGLKVCLGQRTVLVRPDSKRIEPRFLCYLMLGDYVQQRFRAATSGATVPHLNMRDIRGLPMPVLPTLAQQRRISSILGAYDDLIEVNRRRMAVLEEMARRLFEEWFVHFRFPGHEATPMIESEVGRIPDGWKTLDVRDLVHRLPSGKVYKDSDVAQAGATPVIDQSTSEVQGFHNDEPAHVATPDSPVAIFGDHTCKMQLMLGPFSLGPNTVAFVAKELPLHYIFAAIKGLVTTHEYKRHWSDLMKKKVLIATPSLAATYSVFVRPLAELTTDFRQQNRCLCRSRDLLLPRLVSGEISVTTAERELEAIA